MEGAAGRSKTGAFAATPEAKQGAAIADRFKQNAGTIGTKYKGGAEDLKTKAQVLGAIEDIKGERKEKQFGKTDWRDTINLSVDIRRSKNLQLKKSSCRIKS